MRIFVESLINPVLQLTHLLRRRTFTRNERPKNNAAIPGWQKSFGNEDEQPDCSSQTNNPDHWRDPAMSQEPPQRTAIERQHALLNATNDAFHPGPSCTFASFLQQSRTHQRSQR